MTSDAFGRGARASDAGLIFADGGSMYSVIAQTRNINIKHLRHC